MIMVVRNGKRVYAKALGLRGPAKPDAMALDTIFRIHSMTKPLASVAAMVLVEDRRLQLCDPVAKFLPAFKTASVDTSTGTEPAPAMTVQDLLRHMAGLGYGEPSNSDAFKAALAQAGNRFNLIDVSRLPGNDSGGAGAVSTAPDALRFALMMRNGGTRAGQRIPLAQRPGGNVPMPTLYTLGLGQLTDQVISD